MSAHDERRRSSLPARELPTAFDNDLDDLDGLDAETKVQRSEDMAGASRRLRMKQELVALAKLAETMRRDSQGVHPPSGLDARPSAPPAPAFRSVAPTASDPSPAPAAPSASGLSAAAAPQTASARGRGKAAGRATWVLLISALAVPGGVLLGQALTIKPARATNPVAAPTASAASFAAAAAQPDKPAIDPHTGSVSKTQPGGGRKETYSSTRVWPSPPRQSSEPGKEPVATHRDETRRDESGTPGTDREGAK